METSLTMSFTFREVKRIFNDVDGEMESYLYFFCGI